MKILNIIYTLFILIRNLIVKKEDYTLRFVAINDGPIKRWYYSFPHWGFNFDHLEMVSGADTLCEKYSKGTNEAVVHIKVLKEYDFRLKQQGYKAYTRQSLSRYYDDEDLSFIDRILLGRTYTHLSEDRKIDSFWICPVTLFVLGRYPKYIFIKENNE